MGSNLLRPSRKLVLQKLVRGAPQGLGSVKGKAKVAILVGLGESGPKLEGGSNLLEEKG